MAEQARWRSEPIAIYSQLEAELRKAAIQDRVPQRTGGLRIPGPIQANVERVQRGNDFINATFEAHVHELNERMKQAGMPLHCHNG